MDNTVIRFRTKLLLLLALSMLCSGVSTYVVYRLLESYYLNKARFANDPLFQLRRFIDGIGDFRFALLLVIPLTMLFFYLLTKPYARYFAEISRGLHRLASGDFSGRVDVDSGDEIGQIASDINQAGENLQRALERGDFAESSKDQLLLNLAHDLRTPLTSVLGYLDYVLRDDQLSQEQAGHYTRIAYTKSLRLEKLINEMFEVARVNYGRAKLYVAEFDLSELLEQLNEEMYPAFENNGLTARLHVDPNVRMSGDGELLARALENLLTNAVRYGADGQFIDLYCSASEGEAVVRIVNYGDSIPPEQLPHLFEMFYTGDRARSHASGGTGLGLFIVRNIVEQHGGTIAVESSVVQTCFEVRLPLGQTAEEQV